MPDFICSTCPQMSYPVVAEMWTLLEGTLQTQAKRLVEDIAKHQKADPKALWAKIKSQVRIGLLDVDVPESCSCTYPLGNTDTAVRLRCRAPCLLGFQACQKHIGLTAAASQNETADRVFDHEGNIYFVDGQGIARDKNASAKGYLEEGVLYVFEPI